MKRQLREVAKRKRGEDSFPYSLALPMGLFPRTEFDSRKKAAAINTAATFGFRLVRKTCYFLLRHAVKAIPERFEPPLGLVPFGGECVLILPLKVGAEENKGANCSRPTFAVLFSGATTLQCESNRNRPQNSGVG